MSTPSADQVWRWLAEVSDPEIPVISIVDLGIVRDVQLHEDSHGSECVVTITPTYSGCPATQVIADSIVGELRQRGMARVRLEQRISPAWTTDWLSDEGKRKLSEYGIAPPLGLAAEQAIRLEEIGRGPRAATLGLTCPRCASEDVALLSQFGSTPCKSLYRCRQCLEPFEHFKCH